MLFIDICRRLIHANINQIIFFWHVAYTAKTLKLLHLSYHLRVAGNDWGTAVVHASLPWTCACRKPQHASRTGCLSKCDFCVFLLACQGITLPQMYTAAVANIINVAANYALIFSLQWGVVWVWIVALSFFFWHRTRLKTGIYSFCSMRWSEWEPVE